MIQLQGNQKEMRMNSKNYFCVHKIESDKIQENNKFIMAKLGEKVTFLLPKGEYVICGYQEKKPCRNVTYNRIKIDEN